MKYLFMLFMACNSPQSNIEEPGEIVHVFQDEIRDFDYAVDDYAARRNVNRPPRQQRSPNAQQGGDNLLCDAGDESWMRVPCESWGFPVNYDQECYYSSNEDRMILPRCIVDVCGDAYWSDFYQNYIYPMGVQFRDCPREMAGGDLDEIPRRR
jgi:hypothetical protein